MKNILGSVLLESGTGVLEGFFRFKDIHLDLSEYQEYFYYHYILKQPEEADSHENIRESLEAHKRALGDNLESVERFYESGTVTLSKKDGTPLGTYRVHDIDEAEEDLGEEYEYSLTLKIEEEAEIEVRVYIKMLDQQTFGFGKCLIHLEQKSVQYLKTE